MPLPLAEIWKIKNIDAKYAAVCELHAARPGDAKVAKAHGDIAMIWRVMGRPAIKQSDNCPCRVECLHECPKSWPNDEYGRAAPHGESCKCKCPCFKKCRCGA